jgi:hypothetical protein
MARRQPVRAAFDRGQIPTIACFNRAKTQIFGSKAKTRRFKKEDRRGHRSQYRCLHVPSWRSKPDRLSPRA